MNAIERDDKLLADQALVQRAARGSEEARRDLVLHLWPRVRRLTSHLCGRHPECEDLCQEVMVQILRSTTTYRAEGCVESWADSITVRNVLKRLGRSRRREDVILLSADPPHQPMGGEELYTRRERDERLRHMLADLEPQRRTALILKLAWGYSVAEVAETMAVSPATVRYWLKSGRAELRRRATRSCAFEESP